MLKNKNAPYQVIILNKTELLSITKLQQMLFDFQLVVLSCGKDSGEW